MPLRMIQGVPEKSLRDTPKTHLGKVLVTHRYLFGLLGTGLFLLSASGCSPHTAPPGQDAGMEPPGQDGGTASSEDGGGGQNTPDSGTPAAEVIYHPPVHHTSTCQAANIVFPASPIVPGDNHGSTGTVAADFNNDGLTDLLINNISGQSMEVKLNKGNGTFASVRVPGPYENYNYEIDGNYGDALGFSAGDANGDGYTDVLYDAPITRAGGQTTYGLGVALSNGDGTFQSAKVYPVTDSGSRRSELIFAVDLNNDRRDDIILKVKRDPYTATFVMMNNGDGSYGVPKPLGIDILGTAHGVGAADLNGDGKMDIVTTYGDGICALLGQGDGTLTRSNDNGTCANGPSTGAPQAVMVGDLNGDGKPDVVTASSSEHSVFGATLYLNNGKGGFFTGVGLEVASLSTDGQLADLDNDGKLDLVLFTAGNLAQVYSGLGDGSFASTPTSFGLGYKHPYGSDANPLLVGDFLGQGLQGLAVADYGHGGFDVLGGTCRTAALPAPAPLIPGTPVHSTCAPEKVSVGTPSSLSAASTDPGFVALDLNGDGKTDLLKGGGPSGASFQYFLSMGNGTFSAAKSAGGANGFGGIAAGDLNGDGFPDVVYALDFNAPPYTTNPKQVAVALNALDLWQVPEALDQGSIVGAPLQLPRQQPALCLAGIGLQNR